MSFKSGDNNAVKESTMAASWEKRDVIWNGMRISADLVPMSSQVCNGPSWGTIYPEEQGKEKLCYASSGDFVRWLRAIRTMEFPTIMVQGIPCILC